MISAFDLFTVGIGPSSSHTVGPMRAALLFARSLPPGADRVRVELYGSLGATGRGHGTDRAVLAGLMGFEPETVDPALVSSLKSGPVRLLGDSPAEVELHFERRKSLPFHPNGLRFAAYSGSSRLTERTYYSVGGGFVITDGELVVEDVPVPYPFMNGRSLMDACAASGLPVSGVMRANESVRRSPAEIRAGLLHIWDVMQECVVNGWSHDGELPGGLRVRRRAPELYRTLCADQYSTDPLRVMDWVNLFALAVNEENAAGGRVVTAPTNGAAGVLPAVLHYYTRFVPGASPDGVVCFLLTAAAIGLLYKENASISGAEVGCQGEVGSACSMAAGALCEVLGGTPTQVENAAEIGMEHNLGLTCDPIGGLVQVPCIERNAMAAVKAINAARIALRGDGEHVVSLDKVIATMRATGADMKDKYKETSRGGLAVNIIEC